MTPEIFDYKLPERVLVVDDDETIRLLARMTLEAAGYAVSESPDGATMLATFRDVSPDLILLDDCQKNTLIF